MQEPSQIDKNCAQEHSVIDAGGRSPKIVLSEARFVSYFTQLGRFGAAFGSQLGSKGLPKSSLFVQKATKMMSSGGPQKKLENQIWKRR